MAQRRISKNIKLHINLFLTQNYHKTSENVLYGLFLWQFYCAFMSCLDIESPWSLYVFIVRKGKSHLWTQFCKMILRCFLHAL